MLGALGVASITLAAVQLVTFVRVHGGRLMAHFTAVIAANAI